MRSMPEKDTGSHQEAQADNESLRPITNASVVIVAAGQGLRLGADKPKAFIEICGKPLFSYCLDVFDAHPAASDITLVCAGNMISTAETIVNGYGYTKPIKVIEGGDKRWQSVQNGVNSVPQETEWVLVHDGARPFVTDSVIDAVLAAATKFKAVVTVTPEVDTIREFEGDHSLGTVDRARLVRVGTPQLFHKQTLLRAFAKAQKQLIVPTDEACLIELMGIDVGITWGDSLNFKITSPSDWEIAEALIEKRRALLLGRK
jgi:2-C-methyl-D-erythritol 4-phosphate cytidylyltransferase